MDDKNAKLVTRLQEGDETAFEKLFELYKVKAVRTAYLLTNNAALAEDITQEAFVQCYLKIKELRDPDQFKTWFFKILTRLAWKMSAKEKNVIPVENIFDAIAHQDTEQIEMDFIKREDAKKIMKLIDSLEQKQKTVILLYYYNGFSVGEIAKVVGCFEGTVKSRLHTARKNLKSSFTLQKECIEEGAQHAIECKV
ncbi:MAG: RNA polymerase sigma factor [Anaerovorax sp.]